MACHYLDLFVIMAATAWLLDRLLPRPGIRPPLPALLASGTGSERSMTHGSNW